MPDQPSSRRIRSKRVVLNVRAGCEVCGVNHEFAEEQPLQLHWMRGCLVVSCERSLSAKRFSSTSREWMPSCRAWSARPPLAKPCLRTKSKACPDKIQVSRSFFASWAHEGLQSRLEQILDRKRSREERPRLCVLGVGQDRLVCFFQRMPNTRADTGRQCFERCAVLRQTGRWRESKMFGFGAFAPSTCLSRG